VAKHLKQRPACGLTAGAEGHTSVVLQGNTSAVLPPALIHTHQFIHINSYTSIHTHQFIHINSYTSIHTHQFIHINSFTSIHTHQFISDLSSVSLHSPHKHHMHTCHISASWKQEFFRFAVSPDKQDVLINKIFSGLADMSKMDTSWTRLIKGPKDQRVHLQAWV